MPCYDAGYTAKELRGFDQEKIKFLESCLCAVLTSIGKQQSNIERKLLKDIDWEEAGISEADLIRWWRDHQYADSCRKELEKKKQRQNELKTSGINKLTAEEREALGL